MTLYANKEGASSLARPLPAHTYLKNLKESKLPTLPCACCSITLEGWLLSGSESTSDGSGTPGALGQPSPYLYLRFTCTFTCFSSKPSTPAHKRLSHSALAAQAYLQSLSPVPPSAFPPLCSPGSHPKSHMAHVKTPHTSSRDTCDIPGALPPAKTTRAPHQRRRRPPVEAPGEPRAPLCTLPSGFPTPPPGGTHGHPPAQPSPPVPPRHAAVPGGAVLPPSCLCGRGPAGGGGGGGGSGEEL